MEWIEIPINEIGKIVTGNTPDRAEPIYFGGSIPWIKPEDLNNEFYVTESAEYLTKEGVKVARLIPKDSILVSCIGNIGKMALAGCDLTTNQQINSLLVEPDFDAESIYYSIKHFISKERNVNSSLVSILNSKDFGKIKIRIPKQKTNQKLVAIELNEKFLEISKLISFALKQKEAIEALQGAILREIFPFKEDDKLPEGWRWEKIDKLANVNKRRNRRTITDNDANIAFLPMEGVDEKTGSVGNIQLRKYKEINQGYTYFESGDILFAKITPCMQNGKCAIVPDLQNGFGFGSSEFFVLTPLKKSYSRWVYYFLRTIEFRNDAADHFTGSAGQQRVPSDFVQNYPIPVPDDDITVNSICDNLDMKFNEYFQILKRQVNQLEAIEALPAAILRKVFEFKS